MDAKRFDIWTRNRALRLSRRDALRLAAAGGGALAAPAVVPRVLAQSACTLTVHAETAGGPSAPASYDGALVFTLATDGTFTQATFTPNGGAPQPATGRATGRAIDVQISLASGRTLVLAGSGDQPVSTCQGSFGGLFSGPQPGDLGAWQATAAGSASSAPSLTASGQGSAGACAPPQTRCGSNCCPGGAVCSDTANGVCACSEGSIQCGPNCVPLCPQGQDLDLNSCTCLPDGQTEPDCIAEQGACANHGQCCTGYCAGGTCLSCSGTVCGEFGCVDPTRDSQNCGGCGRVCVAPNVNCNGGVCGCAPDGSLCSNHDQCCSDICPPSGICGCVPPGVACNFTGECCDQSSGGCANGFCAYFGGHSCASDTECISGICTNGVCVSCTDPGGACTRSVECCNYNGLGCVNGICPL